MIVAGMNNTNRARKILLRTAKTGLRFDIKTKVENTLVKIRKTACFGKCPVYEFTIFKDGSALFDGLQHVSKTGKQTFNLTKEEFLKLNSLLSKTSFSEYKDSYNNPRVTDLPSVYVTYQGKQIQIRTWKNIPEKLKNLEEYTKKHKGEVFYNFSFFWLS